MRYTLMLLVLLTACRPIFAASQTIEAQWDVYIPLDGYEVAGFALFRNDRAVAYWPGAEITTGEVEGQDVRTGESFELRVVFVNGGSSPKSDPYVIGISAGRFIRLKNIAAGRAMNGTTGVSLQ